MPDGLTVAAGSAVASSTIGWSFHDIGGGVESTSLKVLGAAAPGEAEITALRTAMGDISNAAITKQRGTAEVKVDIRLPEIEVYDEAYAAGSVVAVFVFTDLAQQQTQYLEVPAPDQSIFGIDGTTVDIANSTEAAAVVNAAVALLNVGTANYTYQRGYRSGRVSRASRPPVLPTSIEEPGAADNPPPAPALGPGDDPV